DHYCPDCPHYEGKLLLVKDWREFINRSQRSRFNRFRFKEEAVPADGRSFRFDDTLVEFSPPLPHGEEGTKLGYVIALFVEENLGFIYTSDVGGPVEERVVEWILEREPDIVYLDGFPEYLGGYKVKSALAERARENLMRIVSAVDEVIVDHHAARGLKFYEELEELGVTTASRYMFGDDLPLEALRKRLWGGLELPAREILRRYKVWGGD
ncbi:MAG: hypothetical protein GXO00_02630, partial [Candidatus Diapherotrites archaeon]|nr:hypothetical protein [Candidatus Diapherotrites archaeon]